MLRRKKHDFSHWKRCDINPQKLFVHGGAQVAREASEMIRSEKAECADLVVAYLEQMGVEYVFGVPGGAIEPLYNALARSARRGGVQPMLARHESGAAFMADGYARETGKIGVCCATSGPGATNLITGMACAYDNNIPVLALTGQPALPVFGKHALQESTCTGVNVLEMFSHCTRYNSLVSHPAQLESKFVTALQRMMHSPRGPAHLSIPVDIFRSPITSAVPSYDLRKLIAPAALIDEAAVKALLGMLKEARNIVILIGGGCGESVGAIMQFAAMKNARFIATPDGKGLVNPRHPLFRGVFGFSGHACAEAELCNESVDLILAIGVNMGEWNSGGWSRNLLNDRLVHIDESDEHLSRTPMARLHVRGSILATFNRIVEADHDSPAAAGTNAGKVGYASFPARRDANPEEMLSDLGKYQSDAAPITPQRLMGELGRLFPVTTRYLADAGNSMSWATHYLHPIDRRIGERRQVAKWRKLDTGRREVLEGWLRVTTNFAPMGWAIGGAIGTAAGNRDVPVVCITGDGSFLMNGQEISVAVAEKLTVIFVILNDSALGMVKHGQRLAGSEQTSFQLPSTDFAAMARAMGAHAHSLRSPQDFATLDIAEICGRKGPTLLDVQIDPEEIPPMSVRMRVLSNSI